MSFNRETWLKYEIRKPCPTCNSGTLLPVDGSYYQSETLESIEYNQGWNCYEKDYVFTGHLKCGHCKETVVISGVKTVCEYEDQEVKPYTIYSPKCFYPAPNIINFPKSCPEQFKKIAQQSFSLFWSDIGSCANKIRISVEVLMDLFNVPKTIQKKSKPKTLTLHERLEEFQKTNQEVGNYLLSVKWIGNDGSHYSSIKIEDCLNAYEILEYSLEILYPDRKNKIAALSSSINEGRKKKINN